MDESDAVESLERLGLTGYEAKVFIALQKLGAGTAREVHRVAEVPRSQVYSAAESLEQRGLVEVQQSNPMRYRPVSIDAARSTLRDRFEREQEQAFDYVETVREQHSDGGEEQEDIWTIRGRDQVEDRIVELIGDAEESVVFGTPHADLLTDDIAAALRDRAADGIPTTVVSVDDEVRGAFAGDENVVVTTPPAMFEKDGSSTGRIVRVDGDGVLLSVLGEGEIPGIDSETAFWSVGTNFASVLIELMENSVGSLERSCAETLTDR
ncbi:TrmB family transcriptional regulator [Halostella sp. JP-L12]|uniref:TrmB family transcriptional regulator n=1 Tax=Halostella TaxID=1843185 RepID=UPI000EF7855C|nr:MULTISPECIES: helix-turn-helix domain-containing protein [Halostella]NHN48667.1 TrmB family transcriptional regulator [Halostella sp. JP-L12]